MAIDHVETPRRIRNHSPYPLPTPSTFGASIMSEGGKKRPQFSSQLSSPLANETADGGENELKSAANVNFGNHITTETASGKSGQHASSPIAPSPRRLFQSTAKKTSQSKRNEHPSNTPNHGKQKKKQTKQQQSLALTDNQSNEGRSTRKGYVVPKTKFEHRIRPLTFRGGEVAREEVYDSDDMSRHDQSVCDAAQNSFGHRCITLRSVKDCFLSNNLENLSRLHVEDILTMSMHHHSDNSVHLRVLISKNSKNKPWSDNSELIFIEQEEMEGLGVQRRKIMRIEYFELYAELVPKWDFKSLQQEEMQYDEFLRLFSDEDEDGASNNTFELRFVGMPDDAVMEFKLKDLVDYPGDLMIFGKRSTALRSYQSLFKDKTNPTYIHHIYQQFCLETRGDTTATFALMTAYLQKMASVTTKTNKVIEADTVADIMKNKMTFLGPEKSAYFDRLDTLFKKALEGSMSQFQYLTEPLIPGDVLSEYMNEVKSNETIGLTHVWQALSNMRVIRTNETRSEHLVHSKEMQVFFQLLSLARQADPQRLTYWAFTHALAFYGWGIRNKLQNSLHYWGFSCSTWNRDEKTRSLIKSAQENQIKQLSLHTAVLLTFDNVQRGQQCKFQRGGSSSSYVKGTQHLAIKVVPYTNNSWDDKHVNLTYDANQPIPSPTGFPKFEDVNINSDSDVINAFVDLDSVMCEETPDFEGTRVAGYENLRSIAHILNETRRCFWADNVQPGSGEFNDKKIKMMQTIVRSKQTKALFEGTKGFQDSVTEKWNPEVGEATMAMMLGVNGLEEETGNQCGAHELDGLYRCGVLLDKDDHTWACAEGYENRRIYVFGDCKTVENLDKFGRDLSNMKLSYDEAADQAAVFMDAMSVVINLPGDWHAGLAMLKSIYTLFYDGFLKPFQEALQWKRINSDVGGCYFQACRLAGYVADELTRLLMYEFASTSGVLDDFAEDDASTYKVFACKYAVGFKQFLHDMKSSSDELRRACALYLTMYTKFRTFVDSYRSGDAVGILLGYNSYLPIWHKLGMHKYFERGLSQNEQLLRDCTFARFMEASKNRCVRVHDKKTGKRMTAQDEFLELQNAELAEFQFTKEVESYVRQGQVVGTASRCKRYVDELHRLSTSPSSVPRRSVEPSMIPEKQLILEYLTNLGVSTHDGTRKYNSKHVYQTRAKLTTVLTRSDAKQTSTSSKDHSYNRLYSSIQQIFSEDSGDANQSENDEDEIDEDEIMRPVRNNLDDDDDENENSNSYSDADTVEDDVHENDGHSIKFRKANKMMLHDLEEGGWKSIKALNLKEVRESRVQRQRRQAKVNEEIAKHVREQRRGGENDIGEEVHVVQPWRNCVQRARSDYSGEFVENV